MRYVIADMPGSLWGHIFSQNGHEIMTRFVYDREERRLVAAQYPGGFTSMGQWWTPMSETKMANLADSLENANPEALENPEEWGLLESDEIPEWAAPAAAPAP